MTGNRPSMLDTQATAIANEAVRTRILIGMTRPLTLVALVVIGLSTAACSTSDGGPSATAQSVNTVFNQGKVSLNNAQSLSGSAQNTQIASTFDSMIKQFQQMSFSGVAQSDVQVVISAMRTLVSDVNSGAGNSGNSGALSSSDVIGTDAKQVLSADNALRADFGLSQATSPP